MTKTTITILSLVVLSSLVLACGNGEQNSADESATHAVSDHSGHAHAGQDHQAAEATTVPQVKNGFDGMPAPGTPAHCPVMKNDFKVTANSEFSVYKGKTYVFCCAGCKPQFEKDPEKYI